MSKLRRTSKYMWQDNIKKVLKTQNVCVDWVQLGQEPMAGTCEYSNKYSSTIKGWKFVDQLSDNQLLKKDSSWSKIMKQGCTLFARQ
jgi:hypothetical protein